MATTTKKKSIGKKILFGLLIFLAIAGVAFHIFITRYLPPLVKRRLAEIIVKGSDSLYRFEMGKFDLSFWGGSIDFTDLHIKVDSAVYKKMNEAKKLPPLSCEFILQRGHINGIGIKALIFSHKINIREIVFDSADVALARHFKTSETNTGDGEPLWKLIQPRIRSIHIGNAYCGNLKINYRNIDSAAAFRWQIDKSNILFSDIRVDSSAASDSSRLLFAKNISLSTGEIRLKTTDGLYGLHASGASYVSATQSAEIKQFEFLPVVTNQQFMRHFGYQHEIYKVKVPRLLLKNFVLPRWLTHNRLQADTMELESPAIAIYLDRNIRPNPYSKKGNYPHQLLQKASFIMQVKRLKATDAEVTYLETNNVTNMTGKLIFPSISGTIDNITNDPVVIRNSPECIARIHGSLMNTGKLNTVFRFNLADRSGAFEVQATITNLNAVQLQPLFKAMTAVDMQSFNMQRLDYTMTGNENAGTGKLSMKYDNMDILINKVGPDKTFDKKGFLSFLANRILIYKENPMKDGEERKAAGITVQRDATRSFFNLVWKTLFNSAGEIVLRPLAQRKIEKKKLRNERKEERRNRRKK